MRTVIKSQIVFTLIFGALSMIMASPHRANNFIIGSITILLSFVLMGVGFKLIFSKKLIALAVGIIVFKYAILGIIIYTLVHRPWFNPLWFSFGVSSLILSGFYYAMKEALREGKKHVI